jgi:hypothetical protein
MNKTLLLFIAIVVAGLLQAQQSLTKNQKAVQQTVIKLFDALSNRDSVNLKLCCTDDIALYEYGSVWNMDSLMAKAITLNTATDFKRINSIEFINTAINENTSWTTYNLHSVITRDGKQSSVHWMETVVLVKEKRTWKIKVLHSTLIKRN